MDSSLGFRERDTLHSVYAGLVLEVRVSASTCDKADDFFEAHGGLAAAPANAGLGLREHFHAPTVVAGIA